MFVGHSLVRKQARAFHAATANTRLRTIYIQMKVGVLGAGAVGAYVGCLVQALSDDCDDGVVLVGRQRLLDHTRGGAVCTAVGNAHGPITIAAEDLKVTQDAADLAGCDVVLVAVKSTATVQAASQLAALARRGDLPQGALVLSFQNGVANGPLLASALEPHGVRVLPTMVNFNVVWGAYGDPEAGALSIKRCTPPKAGPCTSYFSSSTSAQLQLKLIIFESYEVGYIHSVLGQLATTGDKRLKVELNKITQNYIVLRPCPKIGLPCIKIQNLPTDATDAQKQNLVAIVEALKAKGALRIGLTADIRAGRMPLMN